MKRRLLHGVLACGLVLTGSTFFVLTNSTPARAQTPDSPRQPTGTPSGTPLPTLPQAYPGAPPTFPNTSQPGPGRRRRPVNQPQPVPLAPPTTPPTALPPGRQTLMSAPVVKQLRAGKMTMNYESIDLRVLARIISELTGRNIVIDERVQGKITILSSTELSTAEAYQLFKAAVERYGFLVVEQHGITGVLPGAEGRRTGHIEFNPRYPHRGDDLAVGVIVMKHGDAAQVVTALRNLVSDPNAIQAYQNGRAIIVADKASIVAKVSELARQLDKATPSTTADVVIPRYAEADKLAPVVQQVLTRTNTSGDQTPPIKVSGFAPANSIIIQGTAQQIAEARRVINELDVPHSAPPQTEKAQFYVHFLQYATADETAKILSSVLSERQSQQRADLSANPNQVGNNSLSSNSEFRTNSPTIGPNGQTAYPTLSGAQQTRKVSFISSKVASDVETNSLILFISPSEYKEVEELLKELDVPRKRVLVLAMVAETSLSNVLNTGAKLQVAGTGGLLSTYNAGLSEEGLLAALAAGSFAIGKVGGSTENVTIQGTATAIPTFFAFLTGQKTNTDFNLISSPRLLTADHKEATLEVGSVVPFPTGASLSTLGNPIVTYDYKDVGIKLKVTPNIAQGSRIRLDVDQQVQEVTGYQNESLGSVGYSVPLISNRSVKTNVTLREGETLLIGGLVSKNTVETISKVPLLGDIPVLGAFFKTVQKTDQKTTLFIALTPYIIDSPEDLARLDRGFAPYLKGDRTPKDGQDEIQQTGHQRHAVGDPYQSAAPPVPLPASVKLRDLVVEAPNGADNLRQARVSMVNGNAQAAEFVLVETVRAPDGTSKELRSQTYKLEAGQTEQVILPPYRFPPQEGVYEFDVSAVNGEDVLSRLPLPTRLEVHHK